MNNLCKSRCRYKTDKTQTKLIALAVESLGGQKCYYKINSTVFKGKLIKQLKVLIAYAQLDVDTKLLKLKPVHCLEVRFIRWGKKALQQTKSEQTTNELPQTLRITRQDR